MLQSLPELPVLVYLEAEEHNARSNIMADAQLRILRVASASRKLREEKYDENSSRPLVTIGCPGHESK
ncbi:hypothetical protein ACFX1X_003663 [Malus domestica]